MNKKDIMSFIKKLTAGALVFGMTATGILVCPKQAEAAVAEDKVIYEEGYDITAYWNADSKTAPVKAGYVFGGWFKTSTANAVGAEAYVNGGATSYYAPLKSTELNTDEDADCDYTGTAYAKFVPAQVLSVKAQNSAGIDENTIKNISESPMYVRVMSSLDSTNYQKVGFEIELANSVPVLNNNNSLETTQVYTGAMVNNVSKTANEIFGGESEYLSVWKLSKIDTPSNASKIIYVRPYWYTMDGTKVEGLAKYVHIEDEYMDYISVPVNLLDSKQVAAGAVNMTYDNTLELVTDNEGNALLEAGRVLPEMSFSLDTANKTIKMIGNAATAGEYNTEETLYANIRFKKPGADTTFYMEMLQFCDWDEEPVRIINTWDVKYDAETVSQ